MSSETSAWAKEQRCGDPVTKAVLMEIANWAKPTGICEFLSVKRIADVTEVSIRTVQRHIARLESEDTGTGGLAMIRRVMRHRDDGGQGANSFELVGYAPPSSLTFPAEGKPRTPRRQSVTPPCQGATAPRQAVREPGDNGDTRLGDKINPPSPSIEGDPPFVDLVDPDLLDALAAGQGDDATGEPAKAVKARRLPDGWTAPSVDDVSPMARELVRQWPSGAYEAVCETFRLHWLSETRAIGRKSDWEAALAKWLITDHPKVMRDMKAGVSFAKLAPAKPAGSTPAHKVEATAAKGRETGLSTVIHAELRKMLGDRACDQWFAPSALVFDEPGLLVIAPSQFVGNYLEQEFRSQIEQAARSVIGAGFGWLRFDVVKSSTGGQDRGQGNSEEA